MNTFNSLGDVQHFDVENSVKKKRKNMQFTSIQNTLNKTF